MRFNFIKLYFSHDFLASVKVSCKQLVNRLPSVDDCTYRSQVVVLVFLSAAGHCMVDRYSGTQMPEIWLKFRTDRRPFCAHAEQEAAHCLKRQPTCMHHPRHSFSHSSTYLASGSPSPQTISDFLAERCKFQER